MRRISWIAGLALLLTSGCAANGPQTRTSESSATSAPQGMSSAEMPSFDAMIQTLPNRAALKATVAEAVRRHDYRAALAMEQAWVKRNPDDLEVRDEEPMLYLATGDIAGWERSRGELTAVFARVRGRGTLPARPGFAIDVFKAGDKTVVAQQCYERAGRFGVMYRFDVTGQDHKTQSFFTVESPEADNQIAREMGRKSPVFFLDYNRPGVHESVEVMDRVPPYPALRTRVMDYIANPKPASSSTQARLANYGCEFAGTGARP